MTNVGDATSAVDDDCSFNDVAEILWQRCTCCHRHGEAAPFVLADYSDFRERREQILEVLQSRYMPPWLPESGPLKYENDTRLSPEQFQQVTGWLESGALEGDPLALPDKPTWPQGWQLGEPDLVVSTIKAFPIPADGPDIYRNFVVPIPTKRIRYVRAMEFRPGNLRVVHHAFMMVDPRRRLRRLSGEDGQPGFGGMDTHGARSPDGHFVGWQPGRRPYVAPPDMPWRLVPNTDLVLQVHVQCTGKPEQLTASVGLFFTDSPPQRIPTKLALRSTDIDIPAGESSYSFENRFTLPVDVDLIALAPHAHYLAKEMYGTAKLPDGTTKTLLSIKEWDLNWQGEYRFKDWVRLPAGTILQQRFVYDNSAENVRNPNDPPQRVTYGSEATDEMGSLWFQIVAADDSQRRRLNNALARHELRRIVEEKRQIIAQDPKDFDAQLQLGLIALSTGRPQIALQYFESAAATRPEAAAAMYHWGNTLLRLGKREAAIRKLNATLQLDAEYFEAHYDLGLAALTAKDLVEAESQFRQVLAMHPFDADSLKQLGKCLISQGRRTEGVSVLKRSLELLDPDDPARAQLEGMTRMAP